MTVSAQTLAFEYTANGVTTTFPYQCRILFVEQLKVYVNGVIQVGGYTVFNVGNQNGGDVVFSIAPAAGATVLIRRISDRVRTTDFQQAPYFTQEELLDLDQDYQTMLLQEAAAEGDKSIKIPSEETVNTTLPSAAERAGKQITFGPSGEVALTDTVAAISGVDIAYVPSNAAAESIAPSLDNGAVVLTDEDEAATPAGVQTRRTVTGGALSAIVSFLKTGMIAWRHGGTGAVWRTLYARLMDLPVSVKDFGAVGDGVTDDTASIQLAFNSGFKLIASPAGLTYRTTGTLIIDANNIEINFSQSAINLDDPTGLLDHLFLGNGSTQRTGIKLKNIVFTRSQVASSGYAINSDLTGVVDISGCRIFGNNRIFSGIKLYRSIITNIQNNYIDNCISRGIDLEGSGLLVNRTVDISIRENRIEGGVVALRTWDFTEGLFCRDNIFFNTSSSAVSVNASSNANGLFSFKFQDNDFDTCGGSGLFIDKVSNVQITGCWFASIVSDALQIKSDAGAFVVSGNQFYPSSVGVRIEGADVRLDNNLISGGTTCVDIVGGTRIGITSNTIQNANVGVNVGSAVDIHVASNFFSGISTNEIQNLSATTSVSNNKGDRAIGTTSFVVVGTSPFTYTAGSRPEYISVFGGAVSQIDIGSTSVGFQTNRSCVLSPNQSITITYSSIPFVSKNILN